MDRRPEDTDPAMTTVLDVRKRLRRGLAFELKTCVRSPISFHPTAALLSGLDPMQQGSLGRSKLSS